MKGIHNLPKGAAILVANHTGWAGLDYAFLALAIRARLGRCPRVLVHPAWFRNPTIANLAHRLGLVQASMTALLDLLARGHVVVIFPEGEEGAFKQTLFREPYQLESFRDGFVRASRRTGAPIVPVSIVGGEEAFPTLGPWRRGHGKLPLPIPISLMPLPVPWRIRIHDPIDVPPRGSVEDGLVDRVRAMIERGCKNIWHQRERSAQATEADLRDC